VGLGAEAKRGAAALLIILVNALAVLFVYWAMHPVAALASTIFHTLILIIVLYYMLWQPEDLKGDLWFALLTSGIFTALIDGSILLNHPAYVAKASPTATTTPLRALLAATVAISTLATLKRPRLAIATGLSTMALLADGFAAEIYSSSW